MKDVDFERQKLRINQGKGNQYAEVNIHPDALQSIADYLRVRDLPKTGYEQALFLSRTGQRIGRTDIHLTVKKYARKAGITKRVYPHLFRISSITHMAEKGLNLEEIRRQSRHKRYETLQCYVQMSDQHAKEVYLKAMSLDAKPKDQTTQAERNYSGSHNSDFSNIYLKLAQQLARGEITQEVYLHAISTLKISVRTEGEYCYQ